MFHYLTGLGYTRTTRRIDLAGHFSLYLVVGFVGLRPAATSHSLDMYYYSYYYYLYYY